MVPAGCGGRKGTVHRPPATTRLSRGAGAGRPRPARAGSGAVAAFRSARRLARWPAGACDVAASVVRDRRCAARGTLAGSGRPAGADDPARHCSAVLSRRAAAARCSTASTNATSGASGGLATTTSDRQRHGSEVAIGVGRAPRARRGSSSRDTRRRSADARAVAPGTMAGATAREPAVAAASSSADAYRRAAPVGDTTRSSQAASRSRSMRRESHQTAGCSPATAADDRL